MTIFLVASGATGNWEDFRGTSLIRNQPPLGPYSRSMPCGGPRGLAFSYERGTLAVDRSRTGVLSNPTGIVPKVDFWIVY